MEGSNVILGLVLNLWLAACALGYSQPIIQVAGLSSMRIASRTDNWHHRPHRTKSRKQTVSKRSLLPSNLPIRRRMVGKTSQSSTSIDIHSAKGKNRILQNLKAIHLKKHRPRHIAPRMSTKNGRSHFTGKRRSKFVV
ncbi:hypothetical protein AB6A40_001517 [Gnathostoma spinigerum]|uniref:Uncharacterized protein n=1 Tax=Gnathostoma spinigerum TaxID=75299 RepID=A0ABD6E4I3_9BILA